MIQLLPAGYAVRNLYRDPTRLVLLMGGSALVVGLVMSAYAFNQGMTQLLLASGWPTNVLLLGAGSEESVERSEVSEQAAGIAAASLAGLATVLGNRAVSPEIVHMAYLELPSGVRGQAVLRGVTPRALLTHPEVALLEGRFPQPGEIMVGRFAWKRMGVDPEGLRGGQQVRFDTAAFDIAGTFAAPGTILESEIWMDLNDLRTLAQRESVSCVVVRLDQAEFADVDLFTKQRLDLELSAVPESRYYRKLAAFYAPVRAMAWATASLIATSALFGGLNTLYAAFAGRVREMATLQAIGFGRFAILISLVQEALLTSMLGALLGAAAAIAIMDDRVVDFSVGAFHLVIGPEALALGLGSGAAVGLIGAIPPAFRCLTPNLPQALRD
jgi:putative ABC transport system permease protein